MKKTLPLFILLCIAHTVFAQLKVNSVGNVGMGAIPSSTAKLLLYNSSTAADPIFGLHSTVSRVSTTSSPLYGAYLTQSLSGSTSTAPSYGIYLENNNNTTYGGAYGFYAKNIKSGYAGDLHGIYIDNTYLSSYGYSYGAYIKNTRGNVSDITGGATYGIQIINVDSSAYTSAYGIHVSNTKTVGASSSSVYGIYASVSGGFNANNRYAGYFTGGKVVMMNGSVGIGKEPTAGLLDVAGSIAINGSVMITSDERLKMAIKPLSEEKDKLYLLQGKSYKKTLSPSSLDENFTSVMEKAETKKEVIEFSEYGYLAQELKEIFPDLVTQDSAGYYAVNYIGLIPVIVEALKDQKLIIEDLQEEIQQKTNYPETSTINELMRRVESLEKSLAICCNSDKLRSVEKVSQQFDLTDQAYENTEEMILYQNTPNPFHENTTIQCYIPQNVEKVQLCVYDIQGVQQKCSLISERGTITVQIQAGQLASGIYTYLLIGDGKTSEAKQMILTR